MKDTTIKDAIWFVREAHKGQKYSTGDYVNKHILPVYKTVLGLVGPERRDVLLAALLHDVVEDTEYGFVDISRRYSFGITEAVIALTKMDNETYMEYINRCSKVDIAAIVKFADLLRNMESIPISSWDEKKRKGMMKRYLNAMAVIGPRVSEIL